MSQYLFDHWLTQQRMGVVPRPDDLQSLHVEADAVIRGTMNDVHKREEKGKKRGDIDGSPKGRAMPRMKTGAQMAASRKRRLR